MDKKEAAGKGWGLVRKGVTGKKNLLIYFSGLLALSLFMLGVGGCRLAREDGLEFERDKLIGVFITREHLDLFDFEGYLNDNISKVIKKGGDMGEISPWEAEKYGGRIYAVLKDFTDTNPETGETIKHSEYVFEDLQGVPFYSFTVEEPEGDSYSCLSSSGAVSGVHQKIGDSEELEGTIYIVPGLSDVFYFNPVYQAGDGRVYLLAGTGIGTSGDMGEGGSFSQTMEEKQTVSENGQETEECFKVTVKFKFRYPAERVSLLAMNSENESLSTLCYDAQDLPEKVEVPAGAAYLILETRCRAAQLIGGSRYEANRFSQESGDGAACLLPETRFVTAGSEIIKRELKTRFVTAGSEIIKRELINPDEEYLIIYIAREDMICEERLVSLQWGKK